MPSAKIEVTRMKLKSSWLITWMIRMDQGVKRPWMGSRRAYPRRVIGAWAVNGTGVEFNQTI